MEMNQGKSTLRKPGFDIGHTDEGMNHSRKTGLVLKNNIFPGEHGIPPGCAYNGVIAKTERVHKVPGHNRTQH
jgi:hypothetical protein